MPAATTPERGAAAVAVAAAGEGDCAAPAEAGVAAGVDLTAAATSAPSPQFECSSSPVSRLRSFLQVSLKRSPVKWYPTNVNPPVNTRTAGSARNQGTRESFAI